eukprot:gene8466-13056_t
MSSDYNNAGRKIILPQSSRRLRHLRGVLVRNMKHEGKLRTSCFKLYKGADVEEAALLYTSEQVVNTLNPTYAELPEVMQNGEAVEDIQGTVFLVVVVDVADSNKEVMRCLLDLERVAWLTAFSADLQRVTEPTVLFEFHDGVFVSQGYDDEPAKADRKPAEADEAACADIDEKTAATLKVLEDYNTCSFLANPAKGEPPDQTSAQSLFDVRYNLTRLVALSYSLEASQKNVTDLQQRVAATLERQARCRRLLISKERTSQRITELLVKVRAAEAKLAEKRNVLREAQRRRQGEVKTVAATKALIAERWGALERANKKRDALKQTFAGTNGLIVTRKQQLVQALRAVFPIEVNASTEALTVCGMHLGKDASLSSDDEAATALGYVAHCMQLLSRIWGVPLRYAVYPIASRSYIHEQFLESSKLELHPLFCTRGSDKQKYLQSVMLLNKNLRQLLQ